MTTAAPEQPIVVGIDGSDASLGAARWAAKLATAQALPLTLLHAIPRVDWHFAGTGASADLDANGDGVLATAEANVRSAHPDLAVSTSTVKGAVATALADASQEARLLVVGTGAADHRALGGHAVRTVHQAQCPVGVWRAPLAKRTGKPLPVVVGVDDSEASGRALAEAFDIARALRAQLTVAHMWEIDAAVGMGDLGGEGNMDWQLLDVLETRQRQRMDELVQPLTKKYPNAHVVKVFRDISPAKGLTDLSREAQLVVVGSHGRGRLAGSVLGSVAQNLIHHAECSVLVVR
ncbi:universal stress protein [Mycobacterium crocinum]|uniref:Universal stress protein n=1 Tax=Mycolicibacterium crocinum TaxID=388459 RepID=A0ABY3TMI7_9MYCO|nr:universal stress protein [Mycolicibacterium crocinum]MCV7214777.1 universal stress protein [Mycolicibacterium crocinum]ULN41541.1 universal stress protein [Mycolicibacterium crocinum]